MPTTAIPDYATKARALETATNLIQNQLLTPLRADAIREDGIDTTQSRTVRGGGQSREHYALAAAEWGMQYGYLKALTEQARREE